MQALSFASYIMMIVGINKAKTDDKNFDSAFSFACIGIVMVVIHLFSGGWFRVLLSAVLGILFLLFRLRIISAVENIAHSLENTDMSGKAKIFSVIFIIFTVISVIFNVVNQAVPDVSILVAGISNIFGIIKSIIFILMRQEDSDFYKSEMNCRQPVRTAKILTIQKSDDKI